MLIAGVAAAVIVLFVLAFLAPRLSWWPQKGVDKALTSGALEAGKAPGKAGRWLPKPFTKSREATDKSASAGRKSRAKLPF